MKNKNKFSFRFREDRWRKMGINEIAIVGIVINPDIFGVSVCL